MAETPRPTREDKPVKRGRRALGLALVPVLFLIGALGGFFGIKFLKSQTLSSADAAHSAAPLGDVAFIPLDPIVINLGPHSSGRFLRFQAQIEVPGAYKAEVALLLPRLMDVLNGYLRAVDPSTLEDRAALVRLKAQMLRRIQLVVGGGKVRDLLVMEFVVS